METSPSIKREAIPEAYDTPILPSAQQAEPQPIPGPSTGGGEPQAAFRKPYSRKPKKHNNLLAYTTSFVPGLYNIKNPAGFYVQQEQNVEVARQLSQDRMRRRKGEVENKRDASRAEGRVVEEPSLLSRILIIHPGSRNLRIGRASDFYPKEVPNCIARPATARNRGYDPPALGSRARRIAQEHKGKRKVSEDVEMNGDGDDESWEDPVDINIGYLRDYLRNRLRQNRLSTDYKEGARVAGLNAKARPEAVPEHNDPYRIDWTELQGRSYVVGEEALRLPESSGFRVRYPILARGFNLRDWRSSQLLLDDISLIIQDSLRTELGIAPREFIDYSVVLIVPDHGSSTFAQEMAHLLLAVMGFKEIAVQQEAYCAIFSAGMSTACVVDIGAQTTSVTIVDEGVVNAESRIVLDYGGDDITASLTALLFRAAFPFRDLDLARSQDWLMMDKLKIKICTYEEHLVASTSWDFYVLRPEGLTQKYTFRTYDENILAPLCFFDTRMIDFEEKVANGSFKFWNTPEVAVETMASAYDEPTHAMRVCTEHLNPKQQDIIVGDSGNFVVEELKAEPATNAETENSGVTEPAPGMELSALEATPKSSQNSEPTAPRWATAPLPHAELATPSPIPVLPTFDPTLPTTFDIMTEASKAPLDAAMAASISRAPTEPRIKAASSNILLIGGSSALKGLSPFISERLPPLLRAKGHDISAVQIVPPPRNLNPRFVSWKGASVMCNLESLGDMWIGRDEWDMVGVRALRDRYWWFDGQGVGGKNVNA